MRTIQQALSAWPRLSTGSQQGLRLHICYAGYLYFVTLIVSEVCWVVTKRGGFLFLALETDGLRSTTTTVQIILNCIYPFRSILTIHQPLDHSHHPYPFKPPLTTQSIPNSIFIPSLPFPHSYCTLFTLPRPSL